MVCSGDRVLSAFVYTEEEGVVGGMVNTWELRVPVSGCEATKYEPLSRLHHSQCPSPLIAAPVEILCTPPISVRIVDPLESCFRIFVSHEFHDHLTVGGGPKGLGSS
jgi:hypothetical protein